jgi:hypothetical protein
MKSCKNCNNKSYAKGLCQSCYQKERMKNPEIKKKQNESSLKRYRETYVSKFGKSYKKRGRKMKRL